LAFDLNSMQASWKNESRKVLETKMNKWMLMFAIRNKDTHPPPALLTSTKFTELVAIPASENNNNIAVSNECRETQHLCVAGVFIC